MKWNRMKLFAIATAALLILDTCGVQAQGFGGVAAGARTLTMNDKVNKNQFVWLSDAPLESIKGSSEGVTGTLTMDPSNLLSIRGTISTQVATMKTGNDTRDHHLKSADWLDAYHDPTISFTITSVSSVQVSGTTAMGTAVGNFTMHGVTKQLSIPFKLTYIPASPKTAARAPGDLVMISSEFNVSLRDYNISGEHDTMGSKVGETIKVT
ncbi:MAG TPA: YceI family protein, partial [Candidatus Kapabacteria bacterium]